MSDLEDISISKLFSVIATDMKQFLKIKFSKNNFQKSIFSKKKLFKK